MKESKEKEQKFICTKEAIVSMVQVYARRFGVDAYLSVDSDGKAARFAINELSAINGRPMYAACSREHLPVYLPASVRWLTAQIKSAWEL